MAKAYTIDCQKSAYFETEKAIGFKVISGVTGKDCGFKWLPKSRITIMSGAEVGNVDINRMSIVVPAWLLKEIVFSKGKNRLECANITENAG